MNGMMYRKSRYSTFSALSHRPDPNDAANAKPTNKGRVRTLQSGANRYHTIITAMSPSVIRKSTKLVMTAPAGTTRRGKYTFEIRLAFPSRLLLDPLSELEKNCHGS